MPRREQRVTLLEMLDAARKARWIAETHRREDLDSDWESAYALRLALQIAGEAANRLPTASRKDNPDVPWNEVIGLRNVLVHGYDTVDLDILWRIAEKDLPPLIAGLERMLREVGESP